MSLLGAVGPSGKSDKKTHSNLPGSSFLPPCSTFCCSLRTGPQAVSSYLDWDLLAGPQLSPVSDTLRSLETPSDLPGELPEGKSLQGAKFLHLVLWML